MLNSLNYTSLESLFHKKRGGGLCLIGIKKEHLFQKKKLSVLIRRLCIWLYYFLLRSGILLDLKTKHIVRYFFYVMFCNLLTYKMISLMQHLN